jgi:SPP1 gp7 family putative phage head morphogenesis protein
MIVELGGRPIAEARVLAHRFLESTQPQLGARSPREARLEASRMREKVAGTKKMRAALLDALQRLHAPVLGALGLREDGEGASDAANVDAAIEAAAAWPDDLFAGAIDEIVREVFDQGGASAAAEVKTSWKLEPTNALDAILKDELAFSRTWVQRERTALKSMIVQAIDEGTPVRELGQNIADFFANGVHYVDDDGAMGHTLPSDAWAEMVARTEVSRAYNAGHVAAYQAAGIKRLRWLTAADERVCPVCAALDRKTAAVGDNFEGIDVDQPPAHPSCRCTTISVFGDD